MGEHNHGPDGESDKSLAEIILDDEECLEDHTDEPLSPVEVLAMDAMTDDTTTIQIDVEVYQQLNSRKKPGDSFNDVLRRFLIDAD